MTAKCPVEPNTKNCVQNTCVVFLTPNEAWALYWPKVTAVRCFHCWYMMKSEKVLFGPTVLNIELKILTKKDAHDVRIKKHQECAHCIGNRNELHKVKV